MPLRGLQDQDSNAGQQSCCWKSSHCSGRYRVSLLWSYPSHCLCPACSLCSPASYTSGTPASGMNRCSQDSVITLTQQVWTDQFEVMSSSNSFILFVMDLALVRKILSSEGLCGCYLSLCNRPDRHPHFCFYSLACCLLGQLTIHGDPGGPEMFNMMLWAL